MLYHPLISLTKPWTAEILRIVMFEPDVLTKGHWFIKLFTMNYPWGWKREAWDILWTEEGMTNAFNNMKGLPT